MANTTEPPANGRDAREGFGGAPDLGALGVLPSRHAAEGAPFRLELEARGRRESNGSAPGGASERSAVEASASVGADERQKRPRRLPLPTVPGCPSGWKRGGAEVGGGSPPAWQDRAKPERGVLTCGEGGTRRSGVVRGVADRGDFHSAKSGAVPVPMRERLLARAQRAFRLGPRA